MKTFEKDKLYQVYTGKDWIIAQYVSMIPAHLVNGLRSDGKRQWREADMHYWEYVTGGHFRLEARGIQTRPVSADTLEEVSRLRSKIECLTAERIAATKELRELCS